VVRILRDADLEGLLPLERVVALMEEGYALDARRDVVPFPRRRLDARGAHLAWQGAAVPPADALGFRAYLYGDAGGDRGEQLTALWDHRSMALRALFVGRRVGDLRTGAALAAAVRLAEPGVRSIGLLGTGGTARSALASLRAALPLDHVTVWSPTAAHRRAFVAAGRSGPGPAIEEADSVAAVLRAAPVVVLATAADQPVVTRSLAPEPRLFASIRAYRFPEIDLPLLDAAPAIWTDSVEQATGPETLLASDARRAKVRPLGHGLEDGALRDRSGHRFVINTGAAWQEVLLGRALADAAAAEDRGVELELPAGPDEAPPR